MSKIQEQWLEEKLAQIAVQNAHNLLTILEAIYNLHHVDLAY